MEEEAGEAKKSTVNREIGRICLDFLENTEDSHAHSCGSMIDLNPHAFGLLLIISKIISEINQAFERRSRLITKAIWVTRA